MKSFKIKELTTFSLIFISGFCFADNNHKAAVYATEKNNGSISADGKNVYTKTFEVTLGNIYSNDIDLSKFCLKAYTSDNKEFTLDTVDEVLTTGILKQGESVKSFAMFSSSDEAILKASIVKITGNCN